MTITFPFDICNPGNEFVTASSDKPNNLRISRFSEEAAWWTQAQAIFLAAQEVGEKNKKASNSQGEVSQNPIHMRHFTILLQAFKKHGHGINNQLAIQFERQPHSLGSPAGHNKVSREKAITVFAEAIFPKLPRSDEEERSGFKPHPISEEDHKVTAFYKQSWAAYDSKVNGIKAVLAIFIPSSGHDINENIATYVVSFKKTLPIFYAFRSFTKVFPCPLEKVLQRVIDFKANDQKTLAISNEDLGLRINGIVQQTFIQLIYPEWPNGREVGIKYPVIPADIFAIRDCLIKSQERQIRRDINSIIGHLHAMLLTDEDYSKDTGYEYYDYRPNSAAENAKRRFGGDDEFRDEFWRRYDALPIDEELRNPRRSFKLPNIGFSKTANNASAEPIETIKEHSDDDDEELAQQVRPPSKCRCTDPCVIL